MLQSTASLLAIYLDSFEEYVIPLVFWICSIYCIWSAESWKNC